MLIAEPPRGFVYFTPSIFRRCDVFIARSSDAHAARFSWKAAAASDFRCYERFCRRLFISRR